MSQDNHVNGEPGRALPVIDVHPTCGGCRFAVPVPGDLRAVECHWGPPMVTTLPVTVAPAGPSLRPRQGLQKFASFPQVAKDWHCFRHEPRAQVAQEAHAVGVPL